MTKSIYEVISLPAMTPPMTSKMKPGLWLKNSEKLLVYLLVPKLKHSFKLIQDGHAKNCLPCINRNLIFQKKLLTLPEAVLKFCNPPSMSQLFYWFLVTQEHFKGMTLLYQSMWSYHFIYLLTCKYGELC